MPKQKWVGLSTLLIRHGGALYMPGKYTVRVQIVPKAEESADLDSGSHAEFDQDSNIINLRTTRNVRQRRADLEHELQHACVDWIDHIMRKVRIRAKSVRIKQCLPH